MANKCRNMCKISDHQGTAYQNHNEISSYLISSYPVRMATDKKTNKQKKADAVKNSEKKELLY